MSRGRGILLVAAVLAGLLSSCGGDGQPVAVRTAPEPTAGTWGTWVLGSPAEIRVPPPPAAGSPEAAAEAEEVAALSRHRTADAVDGVHRWSDYPAIEPWARLNLDLVASHSKNPPL